jgi:hypothetical protein
MDGFSVSPETLRTAAGTLGDVAEAVHRNVASFSGVQNAMNDQARGFDAMRAAAEVEASWQRAVGAQAAKLALDADQLDLNASTYVDSDGRAHARFGGR